MPLVMWLPRRTKCSTLWEKNSFPLRGGRYHFSDSRSFRPALSMSASASKRLSLAFSSSCARSRLASDTSSQPHLAYHA